MQPVSSLYKALSLIFFPLYNMACISVAKFFGLKYSLSWASTFKNIFYPLDVIFQGRQQYNKDLNSLITMF
jgi:hypothetical protein